MKRCSRALLLVVPIVVCFTMLPMKPAQAQIDDSAGQCSEGIRLVQNDRDDEALPHLEAGFRGRASGQFAHPDDLGLCALGLGRLRNERGDLAGALDAFTVAAEAFHRSRNQELERISVSWIGTTNYQQNHYDIALQNYLEALKIAKNLNDTPIIEEIVSVIGQIGSSLFEQADVYDEQGRFYDALQGYELALLAFRTAEDRRGEGATLSNMGSVHIDQGRLQMALENFQQALAIQQDLEDQVEVAATLNNIGSAYQSQGSYSRALEYYQQSLDIVRNENEREGEGRILNGMGGVYMTQGHYDQALETFQHALSIQQEIEDHFGEAFTLGNIGSLYQEQGRFADAETPFNQALALHQSLENRHGEALMLHNLGTTFVTQGKTSQAIDSFQKALVIRREIGDRIGESGTLTNLGVIYARQEHYADALQAYEAALVIARDNGDQLTEGTLLQNIGSLYARQGRYDRAMELYSEAIQIQRNIGNRVMEASTLDAIGLAYQDQNDLTQALTYYKQAIDLLDDVRAVAGSEQGRAAFIAQYANLYERTTLLYHQQGQDDLAFFTSERGRARAFLDSLTTGYVQLSDQDAAALLTRERETYAARQAGQEALVKARALNPPDPALVAELEQQVTNAERDYQAVLAAINDRSTQLAAMVPGRTKGILDVATVQAGLAPETSLVSFFVTADQTLAFILTRDHFQTVALPLGRAALYDQVRALLDNQAFREQAHPPEAVALYQKLITPLKPYLTSQHLIIIPHGVLHYLPFAALSDGQRYLIDEYMLTALPSASVLPFIQANIGRPALPPLILGNPDGTLPAAEQEARTIAGLYGVQPVIGTQATKAALQQRISEAGIVHFATHAVFDPRVPLASSITLAPSPTGTIHLEASEVYALDLHKADLVTLSACQTNLGSISMGDEVVGLTRAFFFAGTPTVISSLWDVDDTATGLLMERFYTHLRAGMGKAEALRQAQMDVRAQYPAPDYWAGFVLAGDPGPLSTTQQPWSLAITIGLVLVLGIIVVVLGLLLYRRWSLTSRMRRDSQGGSM